MNFALIGQNPIQSQFQSLVWYGLKCKIRVWISALYIFNQSLCI